MSQEGYDKLVAQLHEWETVDRPAASAAIAEARDKGDLSENSEYDAAKEAQAMLEMKISNLKAVIAEAKIIDENSFADINRPIHFCGNGAEKCSNVIKNPNAKFTTLVKPIANMMVDLAEEAYRNNQFEDVAYYEPFYLKEFYTPQK